MREPPARHRSLLLLAAGLLGGVAWLIRPPSAAEAGSPAELAASIDPSGARTGEIEPPLARAAGLAGEPLEASSPRESAPDPIAPRKSEERVPADPFDGVEIVVLSCGAPAPGIDVRCRPKPSEGTGPITRVTLQDVRASTTDEGGRARFSDLSAGLWSFWIQGHATSAPRWDLEVSSGVPSRHVIRIGNSTVTGALRDSDGLFVSGRVVATQVQPDSGAAPLAVRFESTAGDVGTYRITGLAAELETHLRASLAEAHSPPPFRLAEHEVRTLDIGPEVERARWRGVVRLPDGRPLPFAAELVLRVGVASWPVQLDEGARFDVELWCGEVEVAFATAPRQPVWHRTLTNSIEADLRLPGGVLLGSISCVDAGPEAARAASREVNVFLFPTAGARATRTALRSGAQYLFHDLGPGDYDLRTAPWKLDAAGGGRAIRVPLDTAVLELDLVIADSSGAAGR